MGPRLDGAEVATSGVALAASTALYVRRGPPYLAQGVLGDLAGLCFLAAILVRRRRRARHEALVCLGFIGLALAADPAWPLRYRSNRWWAAVTLGLFGYLLLRRRVLLESQSRATRRRIPTDDGA